MKQFCQRCGKSYRSRQSRIECPDCEIIRYNQGRKLKNNKVIKDPDFIEEVGPGP